MLVIAREIDQVIRIGDSISITIVDIRHTKVRLGITAPKDVPVHREEVYRLISSEQAAIKTEPEPQP